MKTESAEFQQAIQDFRATSSAFLRPAALLSAIELGLFDAIGLESLDAHAVAHKISGNAYYTHTLLTALTGMGYLERNADTFSLTEVSRRLLRRASPEYEGDSALMSLWILRQSGFLSDVVRSGVMPNTYVEVVAKDKAMAYTLVQAMEQIAPRFVDKLVEHVPMDGVTSVLDLGGASGALARALVRGKRNVEVTLFELPHAAEACRKIQREKFPEERLQVLEGNFLADNLGGPYDLVLVSNVFHLLAPEEAKRLSQRLAEVLHPGGRLVVKDVIGTEPQGPGQAMFALMMTLVSEGGRPHTLGDYVDWFSACGMSAPEKVDCWEQSSLLIATKSPECRT